VEPNRTYHTTVTAFDRHFNRSQPVLVTFATAATPLYREPLFLAVLAVVALVIGFLLWLWLQGRGRPSYREALVTFRSDADRIEARLQVDVGDPEWQPLGAGIGQLTDIDDKLRAEVDLDPQGVATLGGELYRVIAGGDERVEALADGPPIRLGMDFGLATAIGPLPWEVLRAGDTSGEASTDGRLALVRQVAVEQGAPSPGRGSIARTIRGRVLPEPIRVLVALASPNDRTPVASDEYAAIERVARESRGRLEMVPMSLPQRDRLSSELNQDIDVFHFIGHGEMDGDRAVLQFVDVDGWAHATDSQQLTEIFRPADTRSRRPRLVVLSACQSAAAAAGQPASGIAADLVARRVVPAAIGMGYLFHMLSASQFSQAFYNSLIQHRQVDHAVATARSELRGTAIDKEDWLVPRLYAHDLRAATFELNGGR